MKPTHKLLFVLCPMLVLGFIYYSSGKLHLPVWGQKTQLETDSTVGRFVGSVYDKQGFLLQLDTKLSPELTYKYGNLSEGVCKPGYAAAKMTAIYPKFMKPAPMFLDRNFKRLAKVNSYLPPFGFKTQERIIDSILTTTKNYGLGEQLDSRSCKRCIIVGNGGILSNKSLGSRIDEYDVVVRLNEAPVSGYGKDVGTKTTMRITYPEGAIQKPDSYEKDSLFVFSAFKPLDFKWLRQMVFKEKLTLGSHTRLSLGIRPVFLDLPCAAAAAAAAGAFPPTSSISPAGLPDYRTVAQPDPTDAAVGLIAKVKVLAGWDVILTQAVTGVWRRGSHTPNKREKARKRETSVTPVRAEVLKGTEGFWKSVAHYVPREPTEIRILNPYFIQEAAFQFIGLPFNNGLMGKGNIPTLGTVAITMALHNCDEVAVAGFGYDMNTPHAPLHYYETVKMSAIKEVSAEASLDDLRAGTPQSSGGPADRFHSPFLKQSWTHNIAKEKEFLRKLVRANVIADLTNGI
ncbi:CMP-N-acetylneuraminate-beta-1,4-galactoside alpha-2,3-sialyltransferase [Takifugu flavidus]|uniref:CMP-N-acetylneuraminate-beta-1,4-galactoside alpha-2,3-sialyltransferase n=1 Tax=Takifugu flavidus TaxID=433684 RepID=A0A5C6P116_9TELE|nr:CMP-N-acetylneuraminate-beta-1,4-galactoside alpha-2,3-sialyltransferase [Takifugu flavidus]